MAKKKKYIVLSPDGFPIEMDATYPSVKKAEEATLKFVERYRTQGYYSQSVTKITKIPIDEIKDYCRLVEL
jgi:hypothetical protein